MQGDLELLAVVGPQLVEHAAREGQQAPAADDDQRRAEPAGELRPRAVGGGAQGSVDPEEAQQASANSQTPLAADRGGQAEAREQRDEPAEAEHVVGVDGPERGEGPEHRDAPVAQRAREGEQRHQDHQRSRVAGVHGLVVRRGESQRVVSGLLGLPPRSGNSCSGQRPGSRKAVGPLRCSRIVLRARYREGHELDRAEARRDEDLP